ncbi:MAG: mechanosensitive ion channel [Thermoleptolyngbya sp. C42_A2020_037]|nr:mechanosensitive ion channel [Thermoleptolyngbya sp. C42_A2020_037]
MAAALYGLVFVVLRSFFRRLEFELGIAILNLARVPTLIILVFGSLRLALNFLAPSTALLWLGRFCAALLVAAFTFLVGQLFTQAAVYYLKGFAEKTEAAWDDVLIPILETIIPPLIYVFGAFFFLQSLGIDLTGLWVAFGGITFVLGFALKDILANFFSGLVLLIDTPFQFGDMVRLPDGSTAVIKKVGLRVTHLYVIDNYCEVYIPNAELEKRDIVNLSRPTPHYAYSLNVSVRVDADPVATTNILSEIVNGHPDILGDLDEKLRCLDSFFGLKQAEDGEISKVEAGRLRLLAYKKLNDQLQLVESKLEALVANIRLLEKGGLRKEELRNLAGDFQTILSLFGLRLVGDRPEKKGRSHLQEEPETLLTNTTIGLIRALYQAWLKDPDLTPEDEQLLPQEWEQKIEVLKLKLGRLHQKLMSSGQDETRLDNYTYSFLTWLRDNFKESQTIWKEPQVRMTDIQGNAMQFTIRFYVDNIKLEHWFRGNRVTNEVRREIVRRLRQAYILHLL